MIIIIMIKWIGIIIMYGPHNLISLAFDVPIVCIRFANENYSFALNISFDIILYVYRFVSLVHK